jgi:hypothetical protein
LSGCEGKGPLEWLRGIFSSWTNSGKNSRPVNTVPDTRTDGKPLPSDLGRQLRTVMIDFIKNDGSVSLKAVVDRANSLIAKLGVPYEVLTDAPNGHLTFGDGGNTLDVFVLEPIALECKLRRAVVAKAISADLISLRARNAKEETVSVKLPKNLFVSSAVITNLKTNAKSAEIPVSAAEKFQGVNQAGNGLFAWMYFPPDDPTLQKWWAGVKIPGKSKFPVLALEFSASGFQFTSAPDAYKRATFRWEPYPVHGHEVKTLTVNTDKFSILLKNSCWLPDSFLNTMLKKPATKAP